MTPRFQVDLSEQLKRRLFKLQHEARALGVRKKYISSLKYIVAELAERADSLGNELVSPQLVSGITMRFVRVPPLEVEYGVHLESRVVWIKDVRLISDAN